MSEALLAGVSESALRRLAPLAKAMLSTRSGFGDGPALANRSGNGAQFLDHRAYRAGDDVRRVDWRISQRCREPQVRRFLDEATVDWFICVDRSASMSRPDDDKWRLALQLAAAWAYLLLDLGCRVGLMLFSSAVDAFRPLGRGRGQYASLLAQLRSSRVATEGGGSMPGACAQRAPIRSGMLILSDLLAEDGMRSELGRLRGRNVHIMQILSPKEVVAPLGVDLKLVDVEAGRSAQVSLTAEGREVVNRGFEDWCTDLSGHIRQSRFAFTRCDADMDWQTALVAHLTSIRAAHA